MTTEVDICNHALALAGLKPIDSIDAPTDERARRCSILYPLLRDQQLRAHQWNFATDWYQFSAADGTSPPAEFSYRHALPNTILRVRYIAPIGNRFEVIRRFLYSDEATPLAKVTLRITDAATFDAMFVHSLTVLLAANLQQALNKDARAAEQLIRQYQNVFPDAQTIDSMEGDFQQEVISRLEAVR